MNQTLSTVISEIFYCIIGILFVLNGIKALKDTGLKTRFPTAVFWFRNAHWGGDTDQC